MYFMIFLLVCLFVLLIFVPFKYRKKVLIFYLPALIAVMITIGMVLYPKEAFEASLSGLAVWWNIVFPALLPFFIFAQVLIGLGVVHFLGVLLEPVMRPVFNVPGEGSFVMAMGLASGFPLGAVLTSKLRQRKMCSKIEAERLLSFVNTADPLFMFGAVAVGMLHAPHTGIIIALAHYFSAITVGLVMRFYRAGNDKIIKDTTKKRLTKKNIFCQALFALVQARQEDGRPFGQILGDAVRDSISTLMLIGGFIMLFSVIITMLQKVSIAGFFTGTIIYVLELVNMDKALAPAFFSGLLEIDLGCQLAGLLEAVSMEQKIIAASAIIAFSGLSVHAQVASIISPTDMSIVPYSLARILHAFLAAFYAMLLLGPLKTILALGQMAVPVMQTESPGRLFYWYERFIYSGTRFLFLIGCLFIISIIIALYRSRQKEKAYL